MNITRKHWSQTDYAEFIEYVKSQADEKYKTFSDALVPGIETSFGVRVPVLRKIAKDIMKGSYTEYLQCKKGNYREEIMLEGLIMSQIKCDYPDMLKLMKEYAAKINSWDTCDTVTFKGVKKHLAEFWNDVGDFIHSQNPWAQRFGFLHLMSFYLADEYIDKTLEYVDSIDSDFYYVQMMQAWLVATAAAKQRDKTVEYLKRDKLNDFTHNKAIQKIRESYRVSAEDKELVKGLKR